MKSRYLALLCIVILFSFITCNNSIDNTESNKFQKIYAQENEDNSSMRLENGTDILVDNA